MNALDYTIMSNSLCFAQGECGHSAAQEHVHLSSNNYALYSQLDGQSLKHYYFSRKADLSSRRRIFPLADFGTSLINSTPPDNCLNGATFSEMIQLYTDSFYKYICHFQ